MIWQNVLPKSALATCDVLIAQLSKTPSKKSIIKCKGFECISLFYHLHFKKIVSYTQKYLLIGQKYSVEINTI